MLAGPNGSGKSTLLAFLAELSLEQHFPLGFVLNPDDIERELTQAGRLYLGSWGVRDNETGLAKFVDAHPLRPRLTGPQPHVSGGALRATEGVPLGYFIPIVCDFLRRRWLEARESFTFETVLSDAAKLDLLRDARALGYRTYLYYICTDDVLINNERIKIRTELGGHSVPPDKVESRYDRSLALLPQVIALADRAWLFDNSGKSHVLVGEYEHSRLIRSHRARWPLWTRSAGLEPAP